MRRRERRAALHPIVENIVGHPGDALEMIANFSETDQRKLERNAIAVVLIDQAMTRSLAERDRRPPFGFTTAQSIADLMPKKKDRYADVHAALNDGISVGLLKTITADMRFQFDAAKLKPDPIRNRFQVVLENGVEPIDFLRSGVGTGVELISVLLEYTHSGMARKLSVQERVDTVRNSYPLLIKLASQHIRYGNAMIKELIDHPEYFAIHPSTNGGHQLDLTPEAVARQQQLKRELPAETVATGCPALIRMDGTNEPQGSNAIQQLLNWQLEVYQQVFSTIETQP